ncbi:sigma-70 family RNA polymerase sigma factor, partial [Streptomyces sp. NPDC058867]|uniref:sigma-70 family RNA polymerase sigma factor n=1 Tax=Streptomyces sp. NPDC058867 TaxID=3346657 RepID=UPI0036CB11A8
SGSAPAATSGSAPAATSGSAPAATSGSAPAATSGSAPAASSGSAPVRAPGGGRNAQAASAAAATDAGLAAAVRAARAVLDEDRWLRNPDRVRLGAEEEVGLAVLLRGGTAPLGRGLTQQEIAALPRDGERWRAHEALVRHNQPLVRRVAQGFQRRGLDIEDLVQHGSFGLLSAVRGFDATRGYRFATYATKCIQWAITQALADEGSLIRLPDDVRAVVAKVVRAERELLSAGREVTTDSVAYASGLTFAEVEEADKIRRSTGAARRRRHRTG